MFQPDARRPRGTRVPRGAVGTVIPSGLRETKAPPKTVRRRKSIGSDNTDGVAPSADRRRRALADVTNAADDGERRPRRDPERPPRRGNIARMKADIFEDVVEEGIAQVEREIKSWSVFQKEKTA